MKRKKILPLLLFCITLVSCGSKDENLTKEIIGKYYSTLGTSENEDKATYNYFFEKEDEFLADHSLNVKFMSEVTVYDYDFGGFNTVSYEINMQGSWNIKDSKLDCKYDVDKATWKKIKVFYSNEVGRSKFFSLFEILNSEFILPKLKELDYCKSGKSLDIIELNSKKLVLKDSNGKSFSKTKLSQEQPIDQIKCFTHKVDIGTDFEEFINKFTTDSTFQLSRIKFPLIESKKYTKDTWKFLSKEFFHVGELQFNELFIGEFVKADDKNKIYYSFAVPESDNGLFATFEKIDNKWMLVSYTN